MNMRTLDGEQTLVRIFVGDSDQWRHQSFSRALLERMRREGFAGATMIRGDAGFGASSTIHALSVAESSPDLPILIEIVEDDEHVEQLLAILDEMLTGGALVTTQKVRVRKYAAGPKA